MIISEKQLCQMIQLLNNFVQLTVQLSMKEQLNQETLNLHSDAVSLLSSIANQQSDKLKEIE